MWSTSGKSKAQNNDWFENVPSILKNYKAYLNKQTAKVFWIIVNYLIGIMSFMGGLTILGCFYRFLFEPYIGPCLTKMCCINERPRFFFGFVLPYRIRGLFEKRVPIMDPSLFHTPETEAPMKREDFQETSDLGLFFRRNNLMPSPLHFNDGTLSKVADEP